MQTAIKTEIRTAIRTAIAEGRRIAKRHHSIQTDHRRARDPDIRRVVFPKSRLCPTARK